MSGYTDPNIPRLKPDPQPVVRTGRNPLAISMVLVFFVSGVAGLFSTEVSSPTLSAVLGSYVWLWHTGLIIGAGTALVGILLLKPLMDVLVERVGMVWLASLFLSYFVAVCVNDDAYFTTYSGVILGLGIAFGARAWQITRDLRRLRRILQGLPHRAPPAEL